MLINYSTIPTLNRWIAIREQMVVHRRHDTARRSKQMSFFDARRSEDVGTTSSWVELSHVVSVDVQVGMFASGSASLFVSADPVKSSIRTCRFWTPNLRLQMHRLRVCLVSRLFWLEFVRIFTSVLFFMSSVQKEAVKFRENEVTPIGSPSGNSFPYFRK